MMYKYTIIVILNACSKQKIKLIIEMFISIGHWVK